MTAEEIAIFNLQNEYDQQLDKDKSYIIAIDAINKQIPRQPQIYRSCPEDIVLCPVCGSTFAMRNGVVQNYCSNCGQRLGESTE